MRRIAYLTLIGLAIVGLAVVAFVNPAGRLLLQRPTAGDPCLMPADDPDAGSTIEDIDFTSPFNSDNRLVNGAMIRSNREAARPECTRIGNSYRCLQVGAATVEVRTTVFLIHFGVPEGSAAVIFGGPREAFCVLDAPEDER